MDDASPYIRVISGERRGVMPTLARGLLAGVSLGYGCVIGVRNRYYDRLSLPIWLEVPVISVGNLTVGGTGKTPMVAWLCRQLVGRGLKPAVLSRGYRATETGAADELLMISRQCPEAVAIANPDRAAAGQMAVEEYGAQVAVLDDGFQHRRVGRDLDIVLVDATRPFGYDWILPRGLLREPARSLRRAEAVVVTRCDQCEPGRVDQIESAIRKIKPDMPIVRAVHRVVGYVDLHGEAVPDPAGRRVGCFSGIARPDSFRRTLEEAGVNIVEVRSYADHHAYTAEDVVDLGRWARGHRLDALITTEKDAVKLASVQADWQVPIAVLRVEIDLLADGATRLNALIDDMLKDHEDPV